MSRSNNTEIINPATQYFEWSGGKKTGGVLSYWDKDAKERVPVVLPFRFLVLDRVYQVGGGIGKGKDYQGFWSNAIRDSRKEAFVVKNKNGIYVEGLWKEIKDKHTSWVTGLYIAYHDSDKNLQIGFLKLEGAANSAWIDFTQKVQRDIYAGAFAISASEFVDGEIEHYKPVYSWSDKITDETNESAKQLDEQTLQPYLKAYFGREREGAADQEYSGSSHENSQYDEDYDADMAAERDAIRSAATMVDDDIPF